MHDDLLIRVIAALVRVETDLGSEAYERAAHRSLLAIASSRVEAVMSSTTSVRTATIIPFRRGALRDRDPPRSAS